MRGPLCAFVRLRASLCTFVRLCVPLCSFVLKFLLPACGLALIAGCSVSAPGSVETSFLNGVKRNLTVGGKKDRNPFLASPDNVAQGRKQFQNYCTSCHGTEGRNEGVLFAEHVSPPVPRLDSAQVQKYSDGQLRWVIAKGISPSGMPAWKSVLDEAEMWKIVLYIRSLKPRTQP